MASTIRLFHFRNIKMRPAQFMSEITCLSSSLCALSYRYQNPAAVLSQQFFF